MATATSATTAVRIDDNVAALTRAGKGPKMMQLPVKIDADATLAVDGGAPVRATFLPFHQPTIDADDERAVLEALRSGWITTGPKTKTFERSFAAYTGAAHCVAVNSCTAALHLGLEAVGVG